MFMQSDHGSKRISASRRLPRLETSRARPRLVRLWLHTLQPPKGLAETACRFCRLMLFSRDPLWELRKYKTRFARSPMSSHRSEGGLSEAGKVLESNFLCYAGQSETQALIPSNPNVSSTTAKCGRESTTAWHLELADEPDNHACFITKLQQHHVLRMSKMHIFVS